MSGKLKLPTPDRLDRHLGRRLEARRRDLCLTRDELDGRIGATPGTVLKFEKAAKAIGAAELLALADALGVSPAWFFADPPSGAAGDPGAAPAPENVVEAERFIAAYWRIADPKVRRDILGLLKAAAVE